MQFLDSLQADLDARRAQGLYRARRVLEGAQGPRVRVDGRELLSFCSNDYLGLAADARVSEAMCSATRRYGVGSGAAHLINGHTRAHHALEEELADFLGSERALLFSTGYMANLGVLAGLLERGDHVFQDRLNHASLIDGAQLSAARLRRYPHLDVDALARQLAEPSQSNNKRNSLVATDGVFSMDGDIAPIERLAGLARKQQAVLMIDDAHGFGVLGPDGRGSVAAAGLEISRVPVYMATLGKALGTAGAFVAGSHALIESLIQRARSYIYTTAMPAALAEATRASLRLVTEEPWRRDRLAQLVTRLREGMAAIGLPLMPSTTAIQPLLLGEPARALRWSEALLQAGVLVTAIRPPTVPRGSARLRITLSAAHQEDDVDRLLEVLQQLQQKNA